MNYTAADHDDDLDDLPRQPPARPAGAALMAGLGQAIRARDDEERALVRDQIATEASEPAAGGDRPRRPGGQAGNRNADRSRPATPPEPRWYATARADLAREWDLGRFVNWGQQRPGVLWLRYGGTVTTDRRAPSPTSPYLATVGEERTWHRTPASARARVEAAWRVQESAKRAHRAQVAPFTLPEYRRALSRAFLGHR